MNPSDSSPLTRRNMLKTSAGAAAAGALVGLTAPRVHAAGDDTIQIALVGCGGRGTGAAANALKVPNEKIKLVAMADVFQDRLDGSYSAISGGFAEQTDVPEERRFVSFDGYKQAMDCLRPGDVVILATPPAFRWVHLGYAIEKGLNVFMEKPVTVDGPTTKKMFALAEAADKKNLKVGVGLMCRHCDTRKELFNRIQDGEIGDLVLLRANRVTGPTASAYSLPKPDNSMSDLEYQIRRFHSFLWASGGAVSDFLIHNIDECCWMKNDWPIEARAIAGRHYRGDYIDQNFDNYAIEYTFADGGKMFVEGRGVEGCWNEFTSLAHGTKGSAVISQSGHAPSRARTFKNQDMSNDNIIWKHPRREPNPYQLEWNNLIAAIREDKPFNEAKRGAEASLVTSMGRMAAHTGQVITYDDMLNCPHEFAPGLDKMTKDSTPPVVPNAEGKYPVPKPGVIRDREYGEA